MYLIRITWFIRIASVSYPDNVIYPDSICIRITSVLYIIRINKGKYPDKTYYPDNIWCYPDKSVIRIYGVVSPCCLNDNADSLKYVILL